MGALRVGEKSKTNGAHTTYHFKVTGVRMMMYIEIHRDSEIDAEKMPGAFGLVYSVYLLGYLRTQFLIYKGGLIVDQLIRFRRQEVGSKAHAHYSL